MEARLTVNIGLAQLDQGDAASARESLSRGKTLAEAAGDANTAAAAVQGLVAVDGLAGTDAGVGAALAKGQLKDARARATTHVQSATLTRDRIQAALDLAAVERAEGNLESAATRLQGAISEARRAGMMREVASGLGQLGLVYSLGGRMPIAADTLAAGVAEAAKGGYRVVEVDLRCELGITLVHLDRVDEAVDQQRATGVALAKMSYPQGVARQAELGGEIATAQGDLATATSALSQAVSYHEQLGHPLDAARVATRLSAAWQGTDPAQADKWGKKALSLYASAGEKLGPAHLALARALADARAKKLSEALRGFATAAEAAEAVGGGRAQAIADVARQDAAQTLVMLGAGQDVAKLAADQGVTDLMAREESMKTAFTAYETGLTAYGAGRYTAARDAFVAARQSFDALGEPAYALRARRAAAWAQYNGAVAMPIAQAYPVYRAMLEESGKVEDPELQARVYGAVALGAVELKQGDPVGSLRGCADQAEKLGLVDLAARCHGALAERGTDLDERAREARTAASLDPANPSAVYALYSVAVDAYNAGRVDLAVALATLAKAHAGTLAGAIDELLAAAQAP
jgi:tetratricopeptide (TPR) repeat protein